MVCEKCALGSVAPVGPGAAPADWRCDACGAVPSGVRRLCPSAKGLPLHACTADDLQRMLKREAELIQARGTRLPFASRALLMGGAQRAESIETAEDLVALLAAA
jgi:hypothetical protein